MAKSKNIYGSQYYYYNSLLSTTSLRFWHSTFEIAANSLLEIEVKGCFETNFLLPSISIIKIKGALGKSYKIKLAHYKMKRSLMHLKTA